MRALRFGSYSISATRPGTPNLSRLKSIRRYCCLWPPPRWRMVTCPLLLRPPDFRSGSSRDFSGVERVISSKLATERNRVPAVMGRNCRMLISALEHGDRVAILERDDRLLPPRRGAARATAGDGVPAHLHRAHVGNRHTEHLLERLADLVLVGRGVHLERVFLLRLVRARALLGHDRTDDHLMQRGHQLPPFFLGVGFLAERVAAFLVPFFFGAAFLVALAFDFLAALAAFFVALAALAAAGRLRAALRATGSAAGSSAISGSTPVSAASSIRTLSDQRMW